MRCFHSVGATLWDYSPRRGPKVQVGVGETKVDIAKGSVQDSSASLIVASHALVRTYNWKGLWRCNSRLRGKKIGGM